MPHTDNHINAPWTDDQVRSLNDYQEASYFHPFTYGEGEEKVDLIATREGWIAKRGGPVVQTWAHEFTCNWQWQTAGIPGRGA
jgi:hypothetical protein